MPTNFTVVPVEDAEGGSNSGAAAGSSKPVSLNKLFGEEKDEDNLIEPHSGRNTVEDKTSSLACRHILMNICFQCPLIPVRGHERAYPSMHWVKDRC